MLALFNIISQVANLGELKKNKTHADTTHTHLRLVISRKKQTHTSHCIISSAKTFLTCHHQLFS